MAHRATQGLGGVGSVECLRQLQREVPNVFADFEIQTLDDGTAIASSPFVTEG